jgi:hypothetical protein
MWKNIRFPADGKRMFIQDKPLRDFALHSYLKASTGSRRDAVTAGQTPKKTPTATETLKPVITAQAGT